MGMEIRLAADAVPEVEEGSGSGAVASGVGGGGVSESVESLEMDDAERKVDEMVESVKRGGVCTLHLFLSTRLFSSF